MKHLFHTQHDVTSYDMGPKALVRFEESHATDYITLNKASFSAGFEPAKLGSNGKHDNH
jgi:hypothetical protein